MQTMVLSDLFSSEKLLCFLWYYCRSESSKLPDKSAEKKNKKKKKKNSSEESTVESKAISSSGEKQKSDSISEGNHVNSKSSHVRSYSNGLIVEELAMGKPDAKKATPAKQVSTQS